MEIIAGYVGEPHVTSQQERNTNIGIFGSNAHIIGGVNSELEATVVSASLVEISDGMIVCEGCTAEIPRGTSDSLVIENGEQGMKRIDLIVARYTRNGNTAAESMELAVIKGTSAANDPVAPSYNTGLIADGDSPVDFPIYRVNLNGISITSVDPLVGKTNVADWIDDILDKIGSTTMGTTATTLTGSIREHETDITAMQGILNNQMFKTVVKIWDNITIGSDWYWQSNPSIALTGYRPIGIAGYTVYGASSGGVNPNWCIFQRCYITNTDSLDMYVWNQNKSAAAKVQIAVRVLYIKTGLVS